MDAELTVAHWKQAHAGHGGRIVTLTESKKGFRLECSFCYKQLIVVLNVEGFAEVVEEIEYDDFTGRVGGRNTLCAPIVFTAANVTISRKPKPGRVRIAKPGEEV